MHLLRVFVWSALFLVSYGYRSQQSWDLDDVVGLRDEFNKLRDLLLKRPVEKACQTGWIQNKQNCYFMIETPINWYKSLMLCRAMGGDLLKISTSDEKLFIASLIASRSSKADSWWVGLNDMRSEGVFEWTDSTVYTQNDAEWASGEPNNHNNQDCVLIQASDLLYNDLDCFDVSSGATKHPGAICQKPIATA